MNYSALTDTELQNQYEEALAQYRSLAREFGIPDSTVTLGCLQDARRVLRAAQFELLIRSQKMAVAQ